ncbi:hypothetical protein GCM10022246_24690 [Pedobacter ginsengiterrae]|uniref:Fibronectin type-III domain-containing protein n=1 Tax=Pedobacter ginsengiterrae TaxID=871696 RepID=A0ABP7PTX7_9SPHI
MLSVDNKYAFCADYSSLAVCLSAIQTAQQNGDFQAERTLLQMLEHFEKDLLKKLYLRTIRVLGILYQVEGVQSYIGGDFTAKDFIARDFNIGLLQLNGPITDLSAYLAGDFEDEDFTHLDFWVGFQDFTQAGYAAVFKTIINMFAELCSRSTEIANSEKWILDAALIPVLDGLEAIKVYLQIRGLNLCTATEVVKNNDSGVFLQASGSDGADGVAEGLLLRWSLTGQLGQNHLPKGDYYNSQPPPGDFNRPNDYVRIYRTAYSPEVLSIDFEAKRPVINFELKIWSYVLVYAIGDKTMSTRVNLIFTDAQIYNLLAATLDPQLYFYDFLNAYSGIISVEISKKSAFKIGFDFMTESDDQAVLKVEAVCKTSDSEDEPQLIHKTFLSSEASAQEILADNIQSLRIRKTPGSLLKSFYFETYDDFQRMRQSSDWTQIGQGFGLSLNDSTVFERLEHQDYPIDNLWPQYNQGTKVRIANYQDKWSGNDLDAPSLKEAVLTYLDLSATDSRATSIVKKAGATELDEGFAISYLDILNLQAMDYHMARMLGLGHIDKINSNDAYVYRLEYTNRKSVTNSTVSVHNYISLPVSKSDKRLPEKPLIRAVNYGLPTQGETDQKLFDQQGYSSLGRVRAVNIGRELFDDEKAGESFFESLQEEINDNIFEHPKPVAFGIEYKKDGESVFRKPEITQEKSLGKVFYAYDEQNTGQGVVETTLVPDDELSLYIHFERETGIHWYAVYGVNWFSRASEISEQVATDLTEFPNQNTLTPPENLAVHYIQKEDTPVFTTSREQGWLESRKNEFPGQDTGLTRVTFNWTDITDVSGFDNIESAQDDIVRPAKVAALFIPSLPLEITGQISRIQAIDGMEDRLLLQTGSYIQINGELISPEILPSDFFKFQNAILSTAEGQFKVLSVAAGVNGPAIVIGKNRSYDTVSDPLAADFYGVEKKYNAPRVNSRFSMTENLSRSENWNALAQQVDLISFADAQDPVIESYNDSEGNTSKFWIGGINQPAIVTPLFGPGNPQNLAGVYKISFSANFILPEHPQNIVPFDPANPGANPPGSLNPYVEWYKGTVRMLSENPDERKTLEVLRIENQGALELYVIDADYTQNPIQISDSPQDQIEVNFHPGYRVYYYAESISVFNAENIMPLGEETQRKTLFGLQALQGTSVESGFSSSVSLPGVLMARRVEEPVTPEPPLISAQKVRPDETGKAALTFDLKIAADLNGNARKPFGFSFYRIAVDDAFIALYQPDTIAQIYQDIERLSTDEFADTRYYEFINLIIDESTGHFKVFDALPEPYGFPDPDKLGLTDPLDSLAVRKMKYYSAIVSALLPLTEQVPIFSFLKTGLITENLSPVIRDINGNLLSASDAAFNPFPMVRKYTNLEFPGSTFIRFTDYFLNQASRTQYFYAAAETTNELVNGDLSPFSGPVSILHTMRPDIPVLSGFKVVPAINGEALRIDFNLNAVAEIEQISKIRIYRSTELVSLEHPQGISPYFDVLISDSSLMGFQLTDELEDFFLIPYGETLYYRFYLIRTIINEFNQNEDVLSLGSAVTPVRLIDTLNPEAPQISFDEADRKLSWPATANRGSYYLFQQNSKGNWQRIFSSESINNEPMEYPLPEDLSFYDQEGNRVYYRFKVRAENSSGLTSLEEKELTI